MEKLSAEELKNITFPKCVDNCALVEILGIGECENVEYCINKFNKGETNG